MMLRGAWITGEEDMSNVVLLKPTPLAATKAKWDQADSASEQAEQLYIEIGRELKAHKEAKPKDITWADYVRQHFDRSDRRADELIANVTWGETTRTVTARERREK